MPTYTPESLSEAVSARFMEHKRDTLFIGTHEGPPYGLELQTDGRWFVFRMEPGMNRVTCAFDPQKAQAFPSEARAIAYIFRGTL